MSWRASIDANPRLTRRFADFRTVDWVQESTSENRDYQHELRARNGGSNDDESSFGDSHLQQDRLDDDARHSQSERLHAPNSGASNSGASNSGASAIVHNLSKLQRRVNHSEVMKSRLWITFQTWLALSLIGVTIGVIAGCLNIITEWLGDIKDGYCTEGFYLNHSFCCWGDSEECSNWQPWSHHTLVKYLVYIVFSVAYGTIAAILCKSYAPAAAGSGISEVKCIVSGFVVDGFLGWWTLLIKSFALPLVIASGLNVGKEGPSVHYAACAGNVIARLFPNFEGSYTNQSQFLTAAAGTGVAVAFASPIGGVLFGIEEITTNFRLSTMWKSYYTAMVATSVLSAMDAFRTGQIVLFQVHYDSAWHYKEIPFFILLGIFGGFYGIIVSKYNIKAVAFRQRYLKNFPVREVALLCLLTAVIGYWSQFIRLDMTEGMEILFNECDGELTSTLQNAVCNASKSYGALTKAIVSLIFATILRIFFVIISYNCKVPCGIFVPSMAAGATFGKAIGLIAEAVFNDREKCAAKGAVGAVAGCTISGTYSFLGAGAALCGITNLTLAVVIIMFELTGALKYVIPTMIVVATTKIISDQFGVRLGGIADQMVRFNGIPFLDSKEDHNFGNAKLQDAMTTSVVALPVSGIPLGELETLLEESDFNSFPIVDDSTGSVLGMANRKPLLHACHYTRRQASDGEGHNNDPNISNRPILLLSREQVAQLTGEPTKMGYGDDDRNVIDLTHYTTTEVFRTDLNSPLNSVMDNFIKLGPATIVVEDSGRLAGIITKKDMARFELYLHNEEHGDVFLQPSDDALFARIWTVMNDVGNIFSIKWLQGFRRVRRQESENTFEID